MTELDDGISYVFLLCDWFCILCFDNFELLRKGFADLNKTFKLTFDDVYAMLMQTILLLPVIPEGVLQLGSVEMVCILIS